MNVLRKKVSKNKLYSEYVKILNGVLQLSTREAEVFSFLLLADAEGERDNINNKSIRDNIIATIGITEANLSRYLGVIKAKGLIIRNTKGKWVLNDLMRPIVTKGVFTLNFILDTNV